MINALASGYRARLVAVASAAIPLLGLAGCRAAQAAADGRAAVTEGVRDDG
jgi:hypothetical protein